MLDRLFTNHGAVQRLRALPVGTQLDGFFSRLIAQGYAEFSIRDPVWTLRALGRLLQRRGMALAHLDGCVTAAFLKHRPARRRSHAKAKQPPTDKSPK